MKSTMSMKQNRIHSCSMSLELMIFASDAMTMLKNTHHTECEAVCISLHEDWVDEKQAPQQAPPIVIDPSKLARLNECISQQLGTSHTEIRKSFCIAENETDKSM